MQGGARVTLIQKYWSSPDARTHDGANAFLDNDGIARVFVLNETGIRSLPPPIHVRDLEIPPVPGVLPVAFGPGAIFNPFVVPPFPLGAEAGSQFREEVLPGRHIHNRDLRKADMIYGGKDATRLTEHSIMVAQISLGDSLRGIRGMTPPELKAVMAMNYCLATTSGGVSSSEKSATWSLANMLPVGSEFYAVSGLLDALGKWDQAMTNIFSPVPSERVIVFHEFFARWQVQLTSQDAVSMHTWCPRWL